MAKNKVEISGINTSDLKILSSEEIEKLFVLFHQGNLKAKEQIINSNLRLVLSILQKYANKTDNMDDLFQIGVMGLIKAIDNFDLSYGLKLSTYACPMIEGEIRRYLRDNNMLRVSRSIKDLAYKTLKLQDMLTNKLGYVPTYAYIAKELGVKEQDLLTAIESMYDPMSIFEPIYNDGGDTIYLYEQLEDKNNKDNLLNVALKDAMKDLTKRERDIIKKRYIVGKTQIEIADDLGISQAQVSRIEKGAINSLKKVLK